MSIPNCPLECGSEVLHARGRPPVFLDGRWVGRVAFVFVGADHFVPYPNFIRSSPPEKRDVAQRSEISLRNLQCVNIQGLIGRYPIFDMKTSFSSRQFEFDGLIADWPSLYFNVGLL